MSTPVLHTPRCMITIMTEKDAEWLNSLLNDEDVYHYIEGIRLFAKSVENTTEYIKCMLDAYDHGRGFLWKIMRHENPIGLVNVMDYDENPSLCYALNKSYRGRELMYEALVSILSFLSGIENKVYRCDIDNNNVPSILICNKLKDSFNILVKAI